MKGCFKMKVLVFGKNKGVFVSPDSGEAIEYYKVSIAKLPQFVEQKSDVVNVTIGGECMKVSALPAVWELLPDDVKEYENGLLCDIGFDEKKKIVEVNY